METIERLKDLIKEIHTRYDVGPNEIAELEGLISAFRAEGEKEAWISCDKAWMDATSVITGNNFPNHKNDEGLDEWQSQNAKRL